MSSLLLGSFNVEYQIFPVKIGIPIGSDNFRGPYIVSRRVFLIRLEMNVYISIIRLINKRKW